LNFYVEVRHLIIFFRRAKSIYQIIYLQDIRVRCDAPSLKIFRKRYYDNYTETFSVKI